MSKEQIVLCAGPFAREGEDPAAGMKAYTEWRDKLVAEKGHRFYEDLMNGVIDTDGNLTKEAIRAEEEFEASWTDRDDYYGGSNSLC